MMVVPLNRAGHLLALDSEQELREAFECFDDGDKGSIPGQDLRKWLKEVGDRMTDEEVPFLLVRSSASEHAQRN